MPPIKNVGGSITGGVVVGLIALAVRILRDGRKKLQREEHSEQPAEVFPRFLGGLSPAALRLLVDTAPFPHAVIQLSQNGQPGPLPADLSSKSATVSAQDLNAALYSAAAWASLASSTLAFPQTQHLVCIVAADPSAARKAAGTAAAAGYHRVALTIADESTFSGAPAGANSGHASIQSDTHAIQAAPLPSASQQAKDVAYIGRDALAALMGYSSVPLPVSCLLIDVRRHDERTLYGAIRGSLHIPVEQLPSAMSLSAQDFAAHYRFAQPRPDQVVVLHSRTWRRAVWAAQVCADAGLTQVYVYRQGTYGWRLDDAVQPYAAYQLGASPPEPEMFTPEMANEMEGLAELEQLGLLLPYPASYATQAAAGYPPMHSMSSHL